MGRIIALVVVFVIIYAIFKIARKAWLKADVEAAKERIVHAEEQFKSIGAFQGRKANAQALSGKIEEFTS